jgi:deazaflavin-dependent oxidoreductase (nitroreductase family)
MTSRLRRPTGLRRLLYRVPIRLYRGRLGWLLGHRFVLIDHVGRRSGRTRQVVVEVVARDRRTGSVTVASGFGPGADWYRNLRAHPEATMTIGATRIPVRAVPLDPREAADAMVDYARRHPYAAKQLSRFMGFTVGGNLEDYCEVGRQIPFLRLEPRVPHG